MKCKWQGQIHSIIELHVKQVCSVSLEIQHKSANAENVIFPPWKIPYILSSSLLLHLVSIFSWFNFGM